ncbi:MAG TPA: caspase family protein [Polyangia bacterium]|jgi:hypothetical protein|nr:caspase family protein [Polyangia bacterium]
MNRARQVLSLLMLPLVMAGARAVAAAAPDGDGVRLRRFALMIGINDGGATRAKLRYAASDARSMARVLQSLGGVAPGDLVFVAEPSRQATLQGFAQVASLMRAGQVPGVRRELLVYYSGHSDEEGLMLGGDRISYDELRASIKQLPADLRVAILDSCASGAFTRHKGGARRPPFLVDASADMRGHAFLTSSAANEVAQESDRISASFFTYYLVSGLRGAADSNQDHRVTLQEAYQFASQETLARTERTKGGPQHAAYEFELSGTGDMVVTDVRTTQASLLLTPELSGRITVRESGGALVAELRKAPGNTIELGVEAGSYVIALESAGTLFEAQATLASGERAPLARLAFHPQRAMEVTAARGGNGTAPSSDGALAPAPDVVASAPEAPHDRTAIKLGVIPRPIDARTDVSAFAFGFVGDRTARMRGVQLALGYTQTDQAMRGVQMAVGATIARGETRGVQIASGATIAEGSFRGVQLAGAVNGARDLTGVQVAGAANIAESASGLQLSPVNVAGNQRGMQLGVVNVASDASGFRLGVFNVARRTAGFQFGVVNVAQEDNGESFALINIIGNGIHDVAVYATDAMLTNLAFKLGGRHLYTSLGASYQPGDALAAAGPQHIGRATRRWSTEVGIGWRFPLQLGRLEHLELEAHNSNVYEAWSISGNAPTLSGLRLQASVRLARHVALLAGICSNVVVAQEGKDLDLSPGGPQKVIHDGPTTVRIYPGFVLGLHI